MNQTCLIHPDYRVRDRFSAAAESYHDRAQVQRQIVDRLADYFPDIAPPTRILEIGCGTGLLTARLQLHFPNAEIDAIDFAAPMLQQAKSRIANPAAINWIASDIRDFHPEQPYDLIASASCLQWVEPLGPALEKIEAMLQPGGCLLFSLMLRDTLRELFEARERIAPHKTIEQRFRSFADVRALLSNLVLEEEQTYAAAYPSAWGFFKRLHQLGVTGGGVSQSHHPLTRGELNRLASDYEIHYPHPDGGVTALYHAGFFKTKKPSTKSLA